jgi:hypothetical protein
MCEARAYALYQQPLLWQRVPDRRGNLHDSGVKSFHATRVLNRAITKCWNALQSSTASMKVISPSDPIGSVDEIV